MTIENIKKAMVRCKEKIAAHKKALPYMSEDEFRWVIMEDISHLKHLYPAIAGLEPKEFQFLWDKAGNEKERVIHSVISDNKEV